MADSDEISRLIGDLTRDLRPVRRIETPWLSALIWTAAAIAAAALFVLMRDRLPWAAPQATDAFTAPGLLASSLTALLAALAAFQVSLPDRSSAWALLPLPPLIGWIAINGIGCFAYAASPDAQAGSEAGFVQCLAVLLAISVPLSAVMIAMVRRARPLRPTLVAILGGLAAAGAAATLLVFVHPHDATAIDLCAHAVAVAAIVGLNTLVGGRILVPANKFQRAR